MSQYLGEKQDNWDSIARKREMQAESGISHFSTRYVARVEALGLTDAEISRQTSIPTSSLSRYRKGESVPKAEHLFPLSDCLKCDARWLVSGAVGNRVDLVDSAAADWVNLPWFDLAQITEEAKGPIIDTVPFRKDWLNRRILRSTGLWITELPSDYNAVGLSEGDAVICSDITLRDLTENWICIFKGAGKPFVARYSGRPGIDAPIDEIIVSHAELGAGDLHPVARVHARILAKL